MGHQSSDFEISESFSKDVLPKLRNSYKQSLGGAVVLRHEQMRKDVKKIKKRVRCSDF